LTKKDIQKTKQMQLLKKVVQKEAQRRICKNEKCKHFSHDHIRNLETCLVADCECNEFTK